MTKYIIPETNNTDVLHEPITLGAETAHSNTGMFFGKNMPSTIKEPNRATGFAPIIKWPGGKEKELKYIIPNLPTFERYIEPFVGGGAVFMGVRAKEYHINDLSEELIQLYEYIRSSDKNFFKLVNAIDTSWLNAKCFFINSNELIDIYMAFRQNKLDKTTLKSCIKEFCERKKNEINDILDENLQSLPCVLYAEMEKNMFRKMSRMHELELQKSELPQKDLNDNIETAIKSAVYMNFRHLYNTIGINNKELHCALFFFIRNYAYSGMFRYSKTGDFNVPYGGIAYNGKQMSKKLKYYLSHPLINHFKNANIYNLDFEDFLRACQPQRKDFVFLDPPYDSEFSTYAQNSFTKEDQERLANYLIKECPAKWMLIIKNTEFIYNLYNKAGINIRTFDKEYLVSFMNRNDKKVTHLLITNY